MPPGIARPPTAEARIGAACAKPPRPHPAETSVKARERGRHPLDAGL